MTERYETDLTNAEWAVLGPPIPAPKPGGRPAKYDRRRLVDAIRDVRRAAGRKPTPSAAVLDGQSVRTTEKGAAGLRRGAATRGCDAGLRRGAATRGCDAGEKATGRKRFLLVDTLGLVLAVAVLPASTQDCRGAAPLLSFLARRWPRLRTVFADGSFEHGPVRWLASLRTRARPPSGPRRPGSKPLETGGSAVTPERTVEALGEAATLFA